MGRVALFIDVDNLWLSAQSAGLPFQVDTLVGCAQEQGTLAFCRAYADWSVNRQRVRDFHRFAVEMVELPSGVGNKNTADIQLALDAFEIALGQRPPDVIVIASGDRDFVPLVQKLRRYGIQVVGIGIEGAVSGVLQRACDRFISYDSLLPPAPVAILDRPTEPSLDAGFVLLSRALDAVQANNYVATPAQVHQLMQDLEPGFSLQHLGLSFDSFLARAEAAGWVRHLETPNGVALEPMRTERAVRLEEGATDYSFDSPEQAAESYRQILIEKRVPLLPWPVRQRLVHYLWSMFEEVGDAGLSFHNMSTDLMTFASTGDMRDYNVPVAAIRKLLHTLNIAQCFSKDGLQRRYYPDPDMVLDRFVPVVSADAALDLMNRTYVKGIVLQRPDVPIRPDGIALLLFGEVTEETQARARDAVDAGPRVNDLPVPVLMETPPTLGERARIVDSLETRAFKLLREVVERAQRMNGQVTGAMAKQRLEARDAKLGARPFGKTFKEFAHAAEQAGYVRVVDVPNSDFLIYPSDVLPPDGWGS